ncbi:MAG: EamA family transporter RarD [Clostridia bacterium]|nr:EamA family transporter RarD [Clostridia bacterium]
MGETMKQEKGFGVFIAAWAYILWGILPVYWKMIEQVPPLEILSHRVIWSFFFVSAVVLFTKRDLLKKFLQDQIKEKKTIMGLMLASFFISINWLTYIFAVNTGHIVDASLGYYINPLVVVLLGVFVLREKLNFWQTTSFVLAGVGVIYMTVSIGKFPWIAVILAVSFGLYGLSKKLIKVDAALGLLLETLFISPFALGFLVYLAVNGQQSFLSGSLHNNLFLMGTGIATSLPLLLFGIGAQRIPLYMVGLLQYIAPTISLILGVLMYGEPFTRDHMITFACIWTAIAIFTLSNLKGRVKRKKTAPLSQE